MGCDIHVYLERKTEDGWESMDLLAPNRYADEPGEPLHIISNVYSHRDYSLFAALCGVRAYNDDTPKISEPKGIPPDASPETRKEINRWNGDGHSHSWNTLAELRAFQTQEIYVYRSGFISPEAAKDLLDKGITPKMWCQGTSDESWVHRKWKEKCDPLEFLIEAIEAQIVRLDYSASIKPEYGNKYRIVYFFDN